MRINVRQKNRNPTFVHEIYGEYETNRSAQEWKGVKILGSLSQKLPGKVFFLNFVFLIHRYESIQKPVTR